jgi:diacylglycerol kinase family enzyme
MPRRIAVVANASAGTGNDSLQTQIVDAFRLRGLDVSVGLATCADDIRSLTQAALRDGCSTIVAAGGDGTINGVASQIVDHQVLLGVLPSGTLNHFAKDLAIPLALDDAVAVVADGHSIAIDVGDVNGHSFLNNSSIGLYPTVVLERRQQQRLHGRGKWLALLMASVKVWRRYPRMLVTLTAAGQVQSVRTPFVFVGNNAYTLSGLETGKRDCLTGGQLSVYVGTHSSRASMAWLFARAAVGLLDESSAGFALFTTSEVEIRPIARRERVSIDGEVIVLSSPLRYRSRPGVLRVLVPTAAA